jgi:integrase
MGSSGPGRVRVERGIYRQPNGKYAVCWRHAGRLRFRRVGFDLAAPRRERLALIAATHEGKVPVSPRLRFETVAGWWLERFEAEVAAGERHPRTLETHPYQLDRHLLPALGRRRVAALTVDDVAELLQRLRRAGRSAKTAASVLGRAEIERLLAACPARDRLMVATVLYTGLRISEMLGLVWDDVDFAAGVIHVRAAQPFRGGVEVSAPPRQRTAREGGAGRSTHGTPGPRPLREPTRCRPRRSQSCEGTLEAPSGQLSGARRSSGVSAGPVRKRLPTWV